MKCTKCDQPAGHCECARPTYEMADELSECQDAIVELNQRLHRLESLTTDRRSGKWDTPVSCWVNGGGSRPSNDMIADRMQTIVCNWLIDVSDANTVLASSDLNQLKEIIRSLENSS